MGLLNRFLRFIDSKPPLPPPSIQGKIAFSVGVEADETLDEIEEEDETLGYAEGQTFGIEYKDAKGNISTRRITVWHLKRNSTGVGIMVARCHERKAQRSFRMDRVISTIDMDGVVYEPPDEFFHEVFGTDQIFGITPRKSPSNPELEEQAKRIQNLSRPGVQILSYLAHCDGNYHEDEFEQILQYIVERVRLSDLEMEDHHLPILIRWVRNMRPDENNIRNAIKRIIEHGKTGEEDLILRYIKCVADADSEIRGEEFSFMVDINDQLREGHEKRFQELSENDRYAIQVSVESYFSQKLTDKIL